MNDTLAYEHLETLAADAPDADAALAEVVRTSSASPEKKHRVLSWFGSLLLGSQALGLLSALPETRLAVQKELEGNTQPVRWWHRLTPGEVLLGVIVAVLTALVINQTRTIQAMEVRAAERDERVMEMQESFIQALEVQNGSEAFRVPDTLRNELLRNE